MANLSNLSDRKQRLLACSLCRRIWHLLIDEQSRNAVEVAESYADGLATEAELAEARAAACEVAKKETTRGFETPAAGAACWAASAWTRGDLMEARSTTLAVAGFAGTAAVWMRASWRPGSVVDQVRAEELQAHQALLEDIECPSSIILDRTKLPPRIIAGAQTIYAERRFADLPLLADALAEAGCTSADLLAHCRSGGDHVRGCWAVDLVLGKE